MVVLLDSGPLGAASNPQPKPGSDAEQVRLWIEQMVGAGHRVLVPAICDYEVRRELCLNENRRAIDNLNSLRDLGFVPLTDAALLKASELWADVRKRGLPTTDKHALDGDVILAAQALTLNLVDLGEHGGSIVVATTNVAHMDRFVDARLWQSIKPEAEQKP